MSGYRHSGMSREDYEAREQIRTTMQLIEERWPGQSPTLLAELQQLVEQIEAEAEAA